MTRYAPACPTCNDHGRIGNGRSHDDPGFDDGPCPEPDCAAGEAESAAAWAVREREYAQTKAALHPVFAQLIAPFAPKRAA